MSTRPRQDRASRPPPAAARDAAQKHDSADHRCARTRNAPQDAIILVRQLVVVVVVLAVAEQIALGAVPAILATHRVEVAARREGGQMEGACRKLAQLHEAQLFPIAQQVAPLAAKDAGGEQIPPLHAHRLAAATITDDSERYEVVAHRREQHPLRYVRPPVEARDATRPRHLETLMEELPRAVEPPCEEGAAPRHRRARKAAATRAAAVVVAGRASRNVDDIAKLRQPRRSGRWRARAAPRPAPVEDRRRSSARASPRRRMRS